LVFVLDTSGSMSGFPIEKAKELISHALDELYFGDTFNLITFSGDTQILFPEPVFPTAENIRLAKELLNGRRGYGGTEMMKAIRAALAPSDSQDRVRVVCFLTDGYVGNDMEIIGEVQKHPNARVFAFGIGNSVNRFLIEGMAKAGRGDSEIVTLNDKADEAAHRLYEGLRSPLLTDIAIDWRGLPVSDIYPSRLPDLFEGKPLMISGRYTTPVNGSVRLRGKRAGEDFVREIPVALATNSDQNSVLPGFWAVGRLTS
jgi:Ca-activated chloride channel homolog